MYVYGTPERLFVNSTLGCRSRCSYCYLPALNLGINADSLFVLPSTEIINMIENHEYFSSGRNGTIISIGCYSECWDELVRDSTLEIISYLLKKGNSVQFATKRFVSSECIDVLHSYIQWKGQLTIFISSTSISHWDKVERNTDSPSVRFESFRISKEYNIPTYLYIKPVLSSITINDLDTYSEIMRKYDVEGVVIGAKFIKSDDENTEFAPVGEQVLKECNITNDAIVMFDAFSSEFNTFRESIKAVEYWRKM
ncbi:hypothetical protein [Photobacterium leiognathi]|uniref:hypothetical protein n=1 Tax=Photobacterium leiognathi TaxID=553611 RepID=UPI002734DB36|nr:hypothetical protein [Photobacterium leiognathi]